MYLSAYLVPAAIGFLAVALYTHLLSPAEYGEYIIGMSVAGFAAKTLAAGSKASTKTKHQAAFAKAAEKIARDR